MERHLAFHVLWTSSASGTIMLTSDWSLAPIKPPDIPGFLWPSTSLLDLLINHSCLDSLVTSMISWCSVNSLDAVKALCEAGADTTMEVGDNEDRIIIGADLEWKTSLVSTQCPLRLDWWTCRKIRILSQELHSASDTSFDQHSLKVLLTLLSSSGPIDKRQKTN